jgi:8-hydroxy-5-deazaflavin:NADPH oxidoreductase
VPRTEPALRPPLAVLGAGHVGPVVAKAAVEAGYRVAIAGSGHPERVALVARVLSPGAWPLWAADAIEGAEIVVLAIPLHRLETLRLDFLAGRTVIDMMNYWPPTDGVMGRFAPADVGSSEVVQEKLAGAIVVKALNHIGYHEIEADRRPPATTGRRALGVAGDDQAARERAARLVEDIGFDAVQLTGLHSGRLLQPGGPVFGVPLDRGGFVSALEAYGGAAVSASGGGGDGGGGGGGGGRYGQSGDDKRGNA